MVLFRNATAADGPAVRTLVGEVLTEFGLGFDDDGLDADLADIEASYQRDGGCFLVLVDEHEAVVGCGGLYPLTDDEVELRKMYFAPSIRGRGLGRELLSRLLTHARGHDFTRISLETATRLAAAEKLYRSVGFVDIERSHLASRCNVALALDL